MNCKDAEKMIPDFLVKKLNRNQLSQFLEHVENCPDCMEELTIQYLVMTGTSLIEDGKSFDLQEALHNLLQEAHTQVNRGRIMTIFSYVLEALAIVIVMIILIMVIFL